MSNLLNKLELEYPDFIETHLDYGYTNVCCFNRKGTLLAAGTTSGQIVIWDFETRSVAKVLHYSAEMFKNEITALSWSTNGHFLLSGSNLGWVVRWDVKNGRPLEQWLCPDAGEAKDNKRGNGSSSGSSGSSNGSSSSKTKGTPITLVQMHPKNPSLWLVNTETLKPMLISQEGTVPFETKKPSTAHVAVSFHLAEQSDEKKTDDDTASTAMTDTETGEVETWPTISQGICTELVNLPELEEADLSTEHAVAVFSKYGQIYAGSNKGFITILDAKSLQPLSWFSAETRHKIKELVFSRDGNRLLVNASDRVLRTFDLKTKELVTELRDSVNGLHWKTCCFSGNSELIIGGAKIKDKQHIYIWERYGQLLRLLEGPNQALMHLAYHPTQTVLAAVGSSGLIFIWQKRYLENWSAFAADFVELENNEEYIEREDEFDIILEDSKKDFEEEFVDVVSSKSLDSGDEADELIYLPVIPLQNCSDVNIGPKPESEVLADTKRKPDTPSSPSAKASKSRRKT